VPSIIKVFAGARLLGCQFRNPNVLRKFLIQLLKIEANLSDLLRKDVFGTGTGSVIQNTFVILVAVIRASTISGGAHYAFSIIGRAPTTHHANI